jgi:hypothetical protein
MHARGTADGRRAAGACIYQFWEAHGGSTGGPQWDTPRTVIIVPMDGNRSAPGPQQISQKYPLDPPRTHALVFWNLVKNIDIVWGTCFFPKNSLMEKR